MESKRYTDSWGLVHYDGTLHLDNGERQAVCGAVSLERTQIQGAWTLRPHSAPIPYRYCAACVHAWEQQEKILERYAAFVTARLDEDETWALAASHYGSRTYPDGARWQWMESGKAEEARPLELVPDMKEYPRGSWDPDDWHDTADLHTAEVHDVIAGGLAYAYRCEVIPYTEGMRSAVAGHIARQDPARTVARVKAARRMLDRAMTEGHYCASDSWESCPSYQKDGPCDCGQDERVLAILEDLAAPYTDHADHPEA